LIALLKITGLLTEKGMNKMKRLFAVCLLVIMVFALSACNDNSQGNNGDVPAASTTDLQHFPALTALPEFNGKGTVDAPGETADYSYFWVTDTNLDAMKSYGKKLEKAGWVLDESAADYDAESLLYYLSSDEKDLVQLKFMSEAYIRITVGNPETVTGLQ
jgi:hypothetical protein